MWIIIIITSGTQSRNTSNAGGCGVHPHFFFVAKNGFLTNLLYGNIKFVTTK